MSFRVTVRLNSDEREMMDYLCSRQNSEPSNPSELFRLLLVREFRRCKNLPTISFQRVCSENRIGRKSRP